MNTTTITVSSQTNAIKAKRILERNGIRSDLVKIDASKSDAGCTHGLRILNSDYFSAISILRNAELVYSVYNEK